MLLLGLGTSFAQAGGVDLQVPPARQPTNAPQLSGLRVDSDGEPISSKRSWLKRRRFLSAEKKFPIYLEAQDKDKPVGEILRREGLYSTDLARIRQQAE